MKAGSIALLLAGLLLGSGSAAERMALSGRWALWLDRRDEGRAAAPARFPLAVRLPGSLPQQGIGEPPGPDAPWTGKLKQAAWNAPRFASYLEPGPGFRMPFMLQPRALYVGPAWYAREVVVPERWRGKRIVLYLERPHWETRVWVDGGPCLSTNDALSTPHVHDLSEALTPGRHRILVRVDNRMIVDVGVNAHSVSDHTQGNWNGIVGRIELRATEPVWIDEVQVYPSWANRSVRVRLRLGNRTEKAAAVKATLVLEDRKKELAVTVPPGGGAAETVIEAGAAARPWDEFHPNLETLSVRLDNGEAKTVRFGFRDIGSDGRHFLINGRRIFLRGTLECCVFPLTGFPPTDKAAWAEVFRTYRRYGLNHVRFHSWCPPEAAFEAADEAGMYLQVECAAWTRVGDGAPVDEWLYREGRRIVRFYGNHPSFLLMAYGNEPGGKRKTAYLEKWCRYWRARDPRRFHTGAAGWPFLESSDFHCAGRGVRLYYWKEGLKAWINARPPSTDFDWRETPRKHPGKPFIAHEPGEWCAFPDLSLTNRFTGAFRAANLEVFRDLLARRGLLDRVDTYIRASSALQRLCYKAELEAALRTPDLAGFQLLGLTDFPGQGTAPVGVLDLFRDPKPGTDRAAWRMSCGPTVLLARLPARVFTTAEAVEGSVEIAHFGAHAIAAPARLDVRLKSGTGDPIAAATFAVKHPVPTGTNTVLADRFRFPVRDIRAPARLVLETVLRDASGAAIASNRWPVWVYSADPPPVPPADVRVTATLDDKTLAALRRGGKVLWLLPPEKANTRLLTGFSTIFWNTVWTGGQPPHTMGIFCDPRHPALALFPTEGHTDWQWWGLLRRAGVMELDGLPESLRPIVGLVPDWFDPRRLGLLFECRVGEGRLLVCSIDLRTDLEKRPAARQFLRSLFRYMTSDRFRPSVDVDPSALRRLAK